MSKRPVLPAVALLAAIATAACSSGSTPATPSASPPPGESPTPTPTAIVSGLAHPTGADEIVLRLDAEGGFVPVEFLASHLPSFTLYGDGRVVFVQTTAIPPESDVATGQPIRTAVLTEEQVQSLLEYALVDGGLAIARTEYSNPLIADAPTTVFIVNADNDSKTVRATGLGFDAQPGPDSRVLGQLNTLAERLRDFDQGGTIASDQYLAPAFRATLTDASGAEGVKVREWPWDDIAVADFTFPNDPDMLQQGKLVLTPMQVAELGVEGWENGISGGYWVRGDDGKLYSLVARSLLPDEDA